MSDPPAKNVGAGHGEGDLPLQQDQNTFPGKSTGRGGQLSAPGTQPLWSPEALPASVLLAFRDHAIVRPLQAATFCDLLMAMPKTRQVLGIPLADIITAKAVLKHLVPPETGLSTDVNVPAEPGGPPLPATNRSNPSKSVENQHD
jgi:hypothetical protein